MNAEELCYLIKCDSVLLFFSFSHELCYDAVRNISRVPEQNGMSKLYNMLEIYILIPNPRFVYCTIQHFPPLC